MELRCYIVTYDISSPKRWRKVFRAMHGFGEHVQLSVFRCDLSALQHARMKVSLDTLVHHVQDQVLIIDMGKSGQRAIEGIETVGRPRTFRPRPEFSEWITMTTRAGTLSAGKCAASGRLPILPRQALAGVFSLL
jgi:CRISPR-associated protein Cas2